MSFIPLSYYKVKKDKTTSSEPVEYDNLIGSTGRGWKYILLQGNPGSGKSTTLRKICQDFAEGKLTPQIKVVIHVLLGNLEGGSKLEIRDLIHTYIILPDIDIKAINSFAEEHNGEGILFLLDGFDELDRNLQVKRIIYAM